ncbi:MAG: helix-turn-helix domain-containing protein [Nanoarchaeota archaeon]
MNTRLKDLGLNSYESKLWTALLSRGVSTAGELSDIAAVPRSRSYDVLESLEKKGFIIVQLGKPIRYVAVPPEHALEHVKKNIQESAVSQTQLLDELVGSPLLSELDQLFKTGIEIVDPSDLSGVVKGRKNLYHHLQDRINEAKHEVIILTTSSGFIRKSQSLKNAIRKASERKVKIRIAAPMTSEAKQEAENISKFAEIKDSMVNGRFCIIDGKEVTFMVMDDEKTHPNYDFGVWVRSELFSRMLKGFFDESWKTLRQAK